MGSKKNVPEGWLNYTPLGRRIPGTLIICFKVPLKEEISWRVPAMQRFTPSMLINQVPNLVGVIDITNTPRYYNKQVFLENGIHHEKIYCPGHVIPPPSVVECFQGAMQRLLAEAEAAGGKLVGVHCTHGINRTGYLVCRFLIECRGFHPEDAIRIFAESRGHGIERENYLSDLRTLSPGSRHPHSHAEFGVLEEPCHPRWNMRSPRRGHLTDRREGPGPWGHRRPPPR